MKYSAIILAAGSGKRTGLKYNKVLYEIKGKKVIDYSLDFFKKFNQITEIILVVSKEEFTHFFEKYSKSVDKIVIGGSERQESVFKALNEANNDYVIIHDGARPFIPLASMEEIFSNLVEKEAITLGVPVKETIQKVIGNRVVESLKRDELFIVQTPQAFKKALIIEAHQKAIKNSFLGTDDTMLIQKFLGKDTHIVMGDYRNIKLTTLDDIKLLEVIL